MSHKKEFEVSEFPFKEMFRESGKDNETEKKYKCHS